MSLKERQNLNLSYLQSLPPNSLVVLDDNDQVFQIFSSVKQHVRLHACENQMSFFQRNPLAQRIDRTLNAIRFLFQTHENKTK